MCVCLITISSVSDPFAGFGQENVLTCLGYNVQVKQEYPLINTGSSQKPTYVPAEFCELLSGQPIKAKLSPADQDAMIKFACRAPAANAISLTSSARSVLAMDNNALLVSISTAHWVSFGLANGS
jgi:hypothetical protein